MGCVSSATLARKPAAAKQNWYMPLSRSVSRSAPVHHAAEREEDGCHAVSLTSSSYGILKVETPEDQVYGGSFINFAKNAQGAAKGGEDFVFSFPGSDVRAKAKLKPVKQENESRLLLKNDDDLETINTWELMEGLEDCSRTPSPLKASGAGKRRRFPDKSRALSIVQESDSCPPEIGSPVWRKYYFQGELELDRRSYFDDESPIMTPPMSALDFSPIRSPPPSSLMDADAATSISATDPIGGNSGLKLLLSPAKSISGHTSPFKKYSSAHGTSLSFDGATERLYVGLSRGHDTLDLKHSPNSPDLQAISGRWANTDAFKGSSSPLFDPIIMATFEQALETITGAREDWMQLNGDGSATHSGSSDKNTWALSEISSDADSFVAQGRASTMQFKSSEANALASREKRISSSKVLPVDEEEEEEEGAWLLGRFEWRCPPKGEERVVLYFTSLRGVRKTHEDCCDLRLILQGMGVKVDERDVWMHAQFREELEEVLGSKGSMRVPRLFIRGRYIGGAEEVKQLHEEAILVRLLEGVQAVDLSTRKVCEGCGDLRFVPCLTCSGSCKVLDERDEVARCLECNENGLMMCPLCSR